MSTQHPNENRQILEEASAWFVDFRLGELDPAQRRNFMHWLKSSPEHIRAYMEISGTYARLPRTDTVADAEIERLIEQTRARADVTADSVVVQLDDAPSDLRRSESTRTQPGARWALAAAASVLLMVTAGATYLYSQRSVYETTVAEHRSFILDDGSKIELNARTRLRVAFSDQQRLVELLEGQALFHVAKDAKRPFVVRSTDVAVRAIGTRFDVDIRSAGTTVTVVEGRVAIVSETRGQEREPEAAAAVLTAGQQITVSQTAISPLHRVNAAATTAWTQGQLEFDETPLSDVVEQFNRHNRRPVVIETAALNDFRITGIYSSEDPHSLIRFLQNQPDLLVIETPDAIRIR